MAPRAFAGRFLLGANYWSRAGGPRMWEPERFDLGQVRAELAQARAIGLDVLRCFAFVPTFAPRPPAIDAGALGRLRALGEAATEVGIGLLPTALVGHMSGVNFGFIGQGARSLYADPELLEWQRALVAALVDTLGPSPAVLGWVLSNEMPLWAGMDAPADAVAAWARLLAETVHARDPRPVGGGDGAMFGFPTRAVAPAFDWLGPHVYYADADPLRQALNTDFVMRGLLAYGLPIVLEEFGCSVTHAGPAEQAAYWREMIFSAFGSGAAGAIGWCFSDFDAATLGRELPYDHHAFELGFGLTRADGSEKPVCAELRAARALLDGLDLGGLARTPSKTALVVPSYLEEHYPFSWEDRGALRRTLLQAYVLAWQAGLDPELVDEDADLGRYALILCPATQKLRTPTWLALEAAAQAGATVYWSYLSGDHDFHQGPWCARFSELTGLGHRLRYGCFDWPDEELRLRGPGLDLTVPTGIAHADPPYALARLPIEVRPEAAVAIWAHDHAGRPALTAQALGRGRVVFCAYPLERYLARRRDGSQHGGHRLYRLLAEAARLRPAYPTRHPEVQARALGGAAADIVVVQHRGWSEAVDGAAGLPDDAELLLDRGSAAPDALGPKGVRVYRVRH